MVASPEDRVQGEHFPRCEPQRDLLTRPVPSGVTTRSRDFDLAAVQIDDPEFAAAVFQTNLLFLEHLGGSVGGGKHFDHKVWDAREMTRRVDRRPTLTRSVGNVGHPQLVFGQWAIPDLHESTLYSCDCFDQTLQTALRKHMF